VNETSKTGAPTSRDLPQWPTGLEDFDRPFSQAPEDVMLRMHDAALIAALRARLELAVWALSHYGVNSWDEEIIALCREPRS